MDRKNANGAEKAPVAVWQASRIACSRLGPMPGMSASAT
jgi:hypothetical protein